MLNPAAFTDLQNYIKKRIGTAEYRVSGVWRSCPIVESVVMADGTVRIKCQIAPGGACTITGARLKNMDGQAWATTTVNVNIETSSEHVLVWFDFVLSEKEVS